jgi:hypothetical protein
MEVLGRSAGKRSAKSTETRSIRETRGVFAGQGWPGAVRLRARAWRLDEIS